MSFTTIKERIRHITLAHTLFAVFVGLFVIGVFLLVWRINEEFLVPVPAHGGSFDEGIVGSPRFINPLLAFSDADKDLTALIYSGLTKPSLDGGYEPDLASGYTISEDGLTYTFTLRDDIYFHDGKPVTVEDVFFTVMKAQDPLIRSTKQASWDGVEAQVIDNHTIEFRLARPFGAFLENTTLGILPAHLWKNISADQFSYSLYNIEPIGSGPYEIRDIERNSSGIPTEYKLRSFNEYALGKPFIKDVRIHLFDTEDDLLSAYTRGAIDSMYEIANRKADETLRRNSAVISEPLPRTFGVFFNTDVAPIFLDEEVRIALNRATDRSEIVSEVFGNYADPITNPVPSALFIEEGIETGSDIAEANDIMDRNGWEKNTDTGIWENDGVPLSFTLTTSDTPELVRTAEILKEQWQMFGAQIDLEILSVSDLNSQAIRPRDYDALLFGTSVGRQADLYSFWHSSGRSDPGLNIALYTNIDVDAIVNDLRQATSEDERQALFASFIEIIEEETPAVFLFSPDFTYITSDDIHNISLGILNNASDRFAHINTWYIETDKVWNIFNQNE